jgi:pimeloyl-ACP methyl ester carboxylesterase
MIEGLPMALPVVLIPGLIASPRLYAAQLPALWRIGPVAVADHTRHESVADCARHILADAPPRFALAGHSFGGYLSFEIMRQARAASSPWRCWILRREQIRWGRATSAARRSPRRARVLSP